MNKKYYTGTLIRQVLPIVALGSIVACEEDPELDYGIVDETVTEEEEHEPVVLPNSRPNIILMVADDMGFDDMSYRGNTSVETPCLDSLAQISTRFESFYVHSVSAPTRASLLTGRHFLRTGVSGVHAGRDFLNLDEVTIAEALSAAGYKTGMWGKWHSGKSNGYYPYQRGFDEAYMAHLYGHYNNAGTFKGYYNGDYYNGADLTMEGWVDAAMADMAIEFMGRNLSEPFFAYIPFLSVHATWQAPDQNVDKYKLRGQSENFATLNGMLEHLDTQVGRVMDAVEELGIAENTIIIFMSDNGPNYSGITGSDKLTDAEWELRNPSGYSGSKSKNLENGIHSPLFVYWKGYTQAVDNNSVLSVCDLFPTLCDLASASIPGAAKEIEGKSFYNLISNPYTTDKSRTIYISHWSPFFDDEYLDDDDNDDEVPLTAEMLALIDPEIQHIGVRCGDDKLLLNEYGVDAISLWNIAADYQESNNLYKNGSNEEKAKALTYKADVLSWYESVLNDEGAFTIPTFQIGYEDNTYFEVLAYAPASISSGLINETLCLSGFDTIGESATYNIEVLREAKYYVRIKLYGMSGVGDEVFTVSTNLDSDCGDITFNSGSSTSKLVTLSLTEDVTSITITLKDKPTNSLDLSALTFTYKSDL